jgi:hypothetical protein
MQVNIAGDMGIRAELLFAALQARNLPILSEGGRRRTESENKTGKK